MFGFQSMGYSIQVLLTSLFKPKSEKNECDECRNCLVRDLIPRTIQRNEKNELIVGKMIYLCSHCVL